MKSILNTLTKMNNAIGLATLSGVIATIAILASSASAAPVKDMDKADICADFSHRVTTKIDPRMTDELLVLAKGPDSNVRMIATQALGRIGESNPGVIDELLVLAKGPDSDVRMIAARALGRIGESNPRVIDELLVLVKGPDSNVRMIVAQALGHISKSNPRVTDELLVLAKGPDSDVRMIAAQALGGISKRIVPFSKGEERRGRSRKHRSQDLICEGYFYPSFR